MSQTDTKPTDGEPVETPVETTTPETQPTPETPAPDPKPTPEKKETVAEVMDTVVPKKETVGLDKFLDVKKENKEQKQIIKDLEAKLEAGATKVEISADLEAIAAEFPDVDPKFLAMIGKAVEKRAGAIADEKLRPITEREASEKQDKVFKKHFDAVLEDMPEFKGIVNEKVIKRLALDPENADKTFQELIEETYGSSISGKRTIETTTPGGGKDPEPIDFQRARKDSAYFAEIMADPKRKAEYNAKMLESGI